MKWFVRRLLCEGLIILVIWLTGWGLFRLGSWGVMVQKETYWSEVIVRQTAYKKLSPREKDQAREQFMRPGSLKSSDQPFRKGPKWIRLAHAAEGAGAWLKGSWLFVYLLIICFRLAMRLRRSREERRGFPLWLKEELRILALFSLAAFVWYVLWAFLIPSGYVTYQRFGVRSFDYLWDTRLSWYEQLAQAWPYVLVLYPVTAIYRRWRRMFSGGKSR